MRTCQIILGTAIVGALTVGANAQQPPAPAAANPAQTHIGHVMTAWKDTPNMTGFLPAAAADAKVAATHARLPESSDNLEGMKCMQCTY